MLAIKSAFARKEGKTSIVFDEVDTGYLDVWPSNCPENL